MPPIVNRYTRLVGIDHPIVQEGLGPFRTPRLAVLRSLCASLPAPASSAPASRAPASSAPVIDRQML